MKVKKISNEVEIDLDREDLLVINAALNEVCNGIDLFEFETRIGTTREKVEELMGEIQMILDQMEKI